MHSFTCTRPCLVQRDGLVVSPGEFAQWPPGIAPCTVIPGRTCELDSGTAKGFGAAKWRDCDDDSELLTLLEDALLVSMPGVRRAWRTGVGVMMALGGTSGL